ncbi:MAG: cytochrome ubiquinol oxidase subunit I [Victivallaceae bacterium]
MDVSLLSRIQFALCISFHYLFVPLSLGIGLLIAFFEGALFKTKNVVYEVISIFLTKIFALVFVFGVVTGMVQIFAFGTNWSNFTRFTGNIFGSLLGAEGIFAFFLESVFMGILLFARRNLSQGWIFFSAVMVAVGAHMSAFWIVAANSWMQTPAGYALVEDRGITQVLMTDFWRVVNNFSTWDRFIHVVLGCWISGGFFLISLGAYYSLKRKYPDIVRKLLKIGLIFTAICLILQLWSGDRSAQGVAKNQPIKLAAFEGIYKTTSYTPLWVFGIPNDKTETVKGLPIPGGLSLLIHRNFKQPVIGLDQFDPSLRPNIPLVFQAYHLMVALWGVMVLTVIVGMRVLKKSCSWWILYWLIWSSLLPALCNQVGWYAAEMGRQPWVVQGLLKTVDALSPIIYRGQVIQSLIMFSIVFILLLVLFIYLLLTKIAKGPYWMPQEKSVSGENNDGF